MKKLATLVLLTSSVYGANTAETLQQAKGLLERSKPTEAYQLLQSDYDAQSASTQELFLLGMSAKNSGNSAVAKKYFEQLLTRDPNAARVKLELAETVFKQGDKQYARNLLVDVKKLNPPQGVLQNINGFIQQIDNPNSTRQSTQGVQWNFWGETGLMYDTNANAAPVIDSVTMYNIPFTLSEDAKETSDTVKMIKLGVSNAIPLGKRASWQTNISANWQDYTQLSKLDSLQLSLQTGPTIGFSPSTTLSLPISANRVKIGHEDAYYYYGYGISPRLNYRFSPELSGNLATNVANRKYSDDNKPDVLTTSLSPSLQYTISPNAVLGWGLTAGRTKSDNAYDSSRSLGTFASYRHSFDDSLSASLSLGYEGQKYNEREAAFAEERKDKLFNAGLSVTKNIEAIDANVSLSISHSKNNSNLPLYEYKRTQTYLSINKDF